MNVLNRPTLVLNRNWQPINVASVARALILVWNENARVVDPDSYRLFDWKDWSALAPEAGEPFVQAVQQRLCVPEVITLCAFDQVPTSTVTFSRRNIFKRDGFRCQYCGRRPRPSELTIDHVVPRAQGGQTSWTNCVLACISCNHRKRDRTPKEASMHLAKLPRRPKWTPIYSRHSIRIDSWKNFISDAYWHTELDEQ